MVSVVLGMVRSSGMEGSRSQALCQAGAGGWRQVARNLPERIPHSRSADAGAPTLPMLYAAYQSQTDLLSPWQQAARLAASWLDFGTPNPWLQPPARKLSAALEVFSRLRLTHNRPSFGIDTVRVQTPTGERVLAVHEQPMLVRPFGTLLRFAREDLPDAAHSPLPKVLVVAPLSGHFATLLSDTIRSLLADHDVHVTVCQPCVPTLAAVALMAQHQHEAQPRSMTLMAGPIDCRINPTEVNRLATSKPIEWFDQHLVQHVPWRYPGAMRRVYPGFLQLTAFMSMNPERHQQAFVDLYAHRLAGEHDKADTTCRFYEEYFAVNDLPAEFYLETVEKVFQTYDLARGELTVRGEKVEPAAIRRTALFTVEGERDDICAIGQTVAAHDLCSKVPVYMKQHHVQLGVGHYGVFSGRRWQQQIYPRIRDMIHSFH
jgi:poly(3-hydroxybutyrate) depolymerase